MDRRSQAEGRFGQQALPGQRQGQAHQEKQHLQGAGGVVMTVEAQRAHAVHADVPAAWQFDCNAA